MLHVAVGSHGAPLIKPNSPQSNRRGEGLRGLRDHTAKFPFNYHINQTPKNLDVILDQTRPTGKHAGPGHAKTQPGVRVATSRLFT